MKKTLLLVTCLCFVSVSFAQLKVFSDGHISACSASNQAKLPAQKKFLKQICAQLDPEDQIKIIKVSQDAYIIYEGTPQNTSGITKSMEAFTQYAPNDTGTGIAYKGLVVFDLAISTIGVIHDTGST